MTESEVTESELTPVLAWLSREHSHLFFGLAMGVLRNREEAEDVCQHAFMKLCEQWSTLRDRKAAKAWLCRVVVNESFRVLRRRQTERRILEQREGPNEGVGEGMGEGASNPGCLVERRDLVAHALGRLEEPTRTVVVLRQMQGLSGNEVKDLLGCSASEVSRRLHRGLEELRDYLHESNVTPGGKS